MQTGGAELYEVPLALEKSLTNSIRFDNFWLSPISLKNVAYSNNVIELIKEYIIESSRVCESLCEFD